MSCISSPYESGGSTLGTCDSGGSPARWFDLIAYTDTAGRERWVYQLSRHGVYVGEYRTPEELGRHVDLATLVEDDRPA